VLIPNSIIGKPKPVAVIRVLIDEHGKREYDIKKPNTQIALQIGSIEVRIAAYVRRGVAVHEGGVALARRAVKDELGRDRLPIDLTPITIGAEPAHKC
jgi:hypothetical protein